MGRTRYARSVVLTGGMFAFAMLVLTRQLQAQEDPAKKPVTVSVDLTEAPLSEALAEIGKQTQWDICVAANLAGKVTLKSEGEEGEAVLKRVVEQCNGRWLRIYLVEKSTTQRTAWTTEALIQLLTEEQRNRILGMSFEQQQSELLRNVFSFGPGRGGGQGNQPAGPQPGGGFAWDPLQMFRSREHTERISVDLPETTLLSALDAVWAASGYPVVTHEDLDGNVAVDAKNEQLEGVLDRICQPLGMGWRRTYLVVGLENLTREQLGQRMDQGWNMMWDTFFALEAPARQQWLQWGINMLKAIPPDQVAQIRQSQFAPRMVERATGLLPRLTPAQRREITPLAQVLLHVFGGQ